MKDLAAMEIQGEQKTEEYLKRQGFFEDEKEGIKRERVLGILNNLVNNFIEKVAQENGIPEKKNASKIFTFGSYRLGVHSSGADIDTLCIVPNFVSRKDFFTQFYADLEKKAYITNLSKVENTFVPLIKFKIHLIPIDLVFARLDLPSIPRDIDLLDNKLLKHMDERCILSLNGNRVTDEILAVVPNVMVFHKTLRFIKYWAQARSLYGHAYGYMGGVAYAITVAKICQMFPKAGSMSLIGKFFSTYSKWAWPQPVIIKEVPDCNYNLKVWNPKLNLSQRNDKMPIITPVYPPICSTHNITISTLTVIKREFARSASIFESLISEELSIDEALERLCEPSDFFTRHKNYFVVALAGDAPESFAKFLGFAETRLRLFAQKLESTENIAYSYVFPKQYALEDASPSTCEILKTLGCKNTAYTLAVYFVGIEFSSAKLPINASRKMNLKKPVTEFKMMLEQYEGEEEGELVYDVLPMKQKALADVLALFAPASKKRKLAESSDDAKKRAECSK
ncbi:poly(A) polymerase [Nematocida sp. AWRm77]|nr:poly(A) polymerase [Nematocida sp. AWRm77]